MMKMRTVTLGVATVGLITCAPGLNAGGKLALKVTPAVAMAPAYVVATVTVERDVENRQLEVAAESETFFRSSLITLDGERAPRTNQITWRDMPGGEYAVTAVLHGSGGQRAIAQRSVVVISSLSDR